MIRGIRIKEPKSYFNERAELDIFYLEDQQHPETGSSKQYCVVYGKNGSGKTSISKAFFSFQNEKNDYEEISFFDDEMNESVLNKENVFVFNEQFIEENV